MVDEPVLVSMLNDHLFCARRAALKGIEGIRDENVHTLEGSFLHDRTDTPGVEERPGVRIARALPVFSRSLGLVGKADIVEFHRQPDGADHLVRLACARQPGAGERCGPRRDTG